MRRISFQYTHNSTQSALVAVSNAVRRQLLSNQTNSMDNSDEPEDFLDGKFVFQKNKDGTFNNNVICTLREDVIVSPYQMRWSAKGVQVECAKPPSLNNVGT